VKAVMKETFASKNEVDVEGGRREELKAAVPGSSHSSCSCKSIYTICCTHLKGMTRS
jgi:hypothetical protein